MFPTRDQVVALLDRHAHEDGIELRLGTAVNRIDRQPGGWRLRTSAMDIDARQVVVATGNQNTPSVPEWPGMDGFTGELLHSADYRNPGPYRGKKVLVVGSGSSGMEIVHDIATGGAAKAWLAVRTPPNIMLRSGPGGLPADVMAVPLFHLPIRIADAISRVARRADLGDLSEFGVAHPRGGCVRRGRAARQGAGAGRHGSHRRGPATDPIEVVRNLASFDRDEVVLADGLRLDPDVVICATGYRRDLEPLVGHLGVLDAKGKPVAQGEKPAARGLRFIGFTSPAVVHRFYGQHTSKRIAKQIDRELR